MATRKKHWFPVCQDINDDGELWKMTDQFGDRALRVWLEICSILDKTGNRWHMTKEGCLAIFRKTRIKPATGWQIIGYSLANQWLAVPQSLATDSPAIYGSPKYWKYHKDGVPEQFSPLLPSFLSDSSVKKQKNLKPATPRPSVESLDLQVLKSRKKRHEVLVNEIVTMAADGDRAAKQFKAERSVAPAPRPPPPRIYPDLDPTLQSDLSTIALTASPEIQKEVVVWTRESVKRDCPVNLVSGALQAFSRSKKTIERPRGWLIKVFDELEAKQNGMDSEREHEERKRSEAAYARAMSGGRGLWQEKD